MGFEIWKMDNFAARMKIVFFIGGLSGGGAERVVCNLASFLANRNHFVTILSMADDEATYGLANSVKRIDLISQSERKNVLYDFLVRYWRLIKYVRNSDDDVFVVFLPITILMFFSIRWLTKAKVIASERNLPSTYPGWQQVLLRKMAGCANGWVFQTEEQKRWYNVSMGISQVVIPNAANFKFQSGSTIAISERKKVIVNVGRLKPQKNQALLLKAFALIKDKYPDYILSIYGDGPLQNNLLTLARELRIERKVNFHGFVKDISPEILKSSVFVLSSDFEGMPNALMEAMALGIPCISTDCGGGGAKALIENEKNGLLVPCNDEHALANAICRILDNQPFAETIGLEAREICKNLSPEKVYGEWEKFIFNIISQM